MIWSPARKIRIAVAIATVVLATCYPSDGRAFSSPRSVAVEASGDLVVVDPFLDAVLRVDPTTGWTRFVSDASRGAGPTFSLPLGIAIEASGDLVVADRDLEAVVRVDPVTGDRSIVSDAGTGAGPAFSSPVDIAMEASGDLVVSDSDLEALVRVDPVTGDRSIVSDAGTGAGPAFSSPVDIAMEASGDVLVTDAGLAAVVRVDPVSGDRTIVSDAGTGAGPVFTGLIGIAVEASGDILVTDVPLGADLLLRVDPVTGDRSFVSTVGTGTGPNFALSGAIAVEASGAVVVGDDLRNDLFRVDPVTGDRAFVQLECPSAPTPGCTTGFAKGQLKVIERKVGKEKLIAKLLKGPAIEQSDFGADPTDADVTHAAFAVCVYDDTGTNVARLGPARFCTSKPCWKSLGGPAPTGKGYVYKDKAPVSFESASGVQKMTFRGGDAGSSQLKIKAGNNKTNGPSLPPGIASALLSTTSVQLHFLTESECYGAVLTNITKQEIDLFKAR